MADVIIHGMEIPQNCFECPFLYSSLYISDACNLAIEDQSYLPDASERYNGCPITIIGDD